MTTYRSFPLPLSCRPSTFWWRSNTATNKSPLHIYNLLRKDCKRAVWSTRKTHFMWWQQRMQSKFGLTGLWSVYWKYDYDNWLKHRSFLPTYVSSVWDQQSLFQAFHFCQVLFNLTKQLLGVYNTAIAYKTMCPVLIWASSWGYCTYHMGDLRRLRPRQSRHCSHTWSMEVDEGSDI